MLDSNGTDAALTVHTIDRDGLGPAVRWLWDRSRETEEPERRAYLLGLAELAFVRLANGDTSSAIRFFDEMIGILRRPSDERLALLQLWEASSTLGMVLASEDNDETEGEV